MSEESKIMLAMILGISAVAVTLIIYSHWVAAVVLIILMLGSLSVTSDKK